MPNYKGSMQKSKQTQQRLRIAMSSYSSCFALLLELEMRDLGTEPILLFSLSKKQK
jgi:hypothetical protein